MEKTSNHGNHDVKMHKKSFVSKNIFRNFFKKR